MPPALAPLAIILHPALIAAGAAAASVPIIIHWLNRRRVRPLPWAAMQWLLAALKKQQRRLKMENWLILLLRCLALFLLGIALSRWVAADSPLAVLARPSRSVVLLLDTSYSTGARDGARSVLDRVRDESDRILERLGSDDVVAVVVSNDVRTDRAGTHAALLVPRTVGRDVGRARATVGTIRATEAPAAWPEALLAAAPKQVLQEQDKNRTLYWLTDLQAKDWRPPGNRGGADPLRDSIELLRREGVQIEIVDVGGFGDAALGNVVVESLTLGEESDVFVHGGFRVVVGVANYGQKAVERATLRLFLDDSPSPIRTMTCPPLPSANLAALEPGRPNAAVSIDVPPDSAPKSPGAHALRVEVTPPEADPRADSIGLDSRRVLALDVRSRLRIAAWIEPSTRAQYDPADLLRGLFVGEGSGDRFDYTAVRSEDELRRAVSDLARPVGLVILGNRVPRGGDAERELARYVRTGGAIAVFVGDDFDESLWNSAFYANPANRLLPYRFGPHEVRDAAAGNPYRLDARRFSAHPLSKEFGAPDMAFVWSPAPTLFGRTRLLPPDASPTPAGPAPTPASATPAIDDTVIIRFLEGDGASPGAPAVVEGPVGLGRALYAGISLDDGWTQLDAYAALLPVLLNDASLLMTRGATTGRNLAVGGLIRASIPRDATNVRLSIPGRGEESPTVRVAASEDERPSADYDRVGTSGVWRLTYDRPPERGASTTVLRKEEQAFGVNPEPSEGSLLRATADQVRHRVPGVELNVTHGFEDASKTQAPSHEGEVTGMLLALVLGVLLLEPYLAMRFGRHDARGAAPSPASPTTASTSSPTTGASAATATQA